MRQELRDSNGRLIGTITATSNKLEGKDSNGRLKGTYDTKANVTRDSNGRVVGKGNLLAALINSAMA